MTWSEDELALLDAAEELEIAVRRSDGTLRRWTPVWVVRASDQVFVRTWHRRGTGWYGAALRSGAARVRVPGLEAEVLVEDVGALPAEQARAVDDAYRTSYGPGAESMVTPEAVASTLRLVPADGTADGTDDSTVGGRS